jgi:hypothetical protein
MTQAPTLHVAQARALVELLDRAMADETPRELIGSVLMSDGRLLHVRRWPWHVGVSNHPNPREHSGWTLRMYDQVEALRNAIDRATSDTDSRAA